MDDDEDSENDTNQEDYELQVNQKVNENADSNKLDENHHKTAKRGDVNLERPLQ